MSPSDASLALLLWEIEQMYLSNPTNLKPTWRHPEIGCQYVVLDYIYTVEQEQKVFFGLIVRRVVDSQVLVALRGTENIHEWVEDVEFEELSLGCDCCVERGFYEMACALRLSSGCLLRSHVPDGAILVGHSLGGAVAIIISAFELKPKEVITFGSPKVGNKRYKEYCQNSLPKGSRLYISVDDVVPFFPPPPYEQIEKYVVRLEANKHPLTNAPLSESVTNNHSCLTYAWLIDNNVSIPSTPSKWYERMADWLTTALL